MDRASIHALPVDRASIRALPAPVIHSLTFPYQDHVSTYRYKYKEKTTTTKLDGALIAKNYKPKCCFVGRNMKKEKNKRRWRRNKKKRIRTRQRRKSGRDKDALQRTHHENVIITDIYVQAMTIGWKVVETCV